MFVPSIIKLSLDFTAELYNWKRNVSVSDKALYVWDKLLLYVAPSNSS